MPLNEYFKGHGDKVMASMMKSHKGDAKAARREFYAAANKRQMGRKSSRAAKSRSA